MKVSVCMITFNQARFIEQAVRSALDQNTDFDYEIVVGDDCSTDGTREIGERLAAAQPDKIRMLTRPSNLGVTRNLWETIRACRGEYVALLEGDDYWVDASKLRRQASLLDRHQDLSFVFHRARVVYEDQRAARAEPSRWFPRITAIEDLLRRGNYVHTASVMFRRSALPAVPDWFFDLRLGDYTLHVLNAATGRIGYTPRIMSAYRVHSGGTFSAAARSQRVTQMTKALQLIDEHFAGRYAMPIARFRHYLLAVEHARDGDDARAKAEARQLLRSSRFDRTTVTALLIAHVLWLYRLLARI